MLKRLMRRLFGEPVSDEPDGAALIAAERLRQILVKGYDAAHDDEHGDGSLLHAALLILLDETGHTLSGVDPPDRNGPWPDQLLLHVRKKYVGDAVQRLAIAGALVAAEMDRRLRERARPGGDCRM